MKEKQSMFTTRGALFFMAFAFVLLVSPSACAPTGGKNANEKKREIELPAWPGPPKNARIIFNKTLRRPVDWGFKRSFPGKVLDIVAGKRRDVDFVAPFAIALGPDGNTVITDTTRGAVYFLDFKRNKYRVIHKANKERLLSPVGAAIDSDGNFYVSDSRLKKIVVFNNKGKYQGVLGADGIFERPTGMAINRQSGILYVVDTLSCQVVMMNLDGTEVGRFGGKGSNPGLMHFPTSIALTPDGNVVVNDSLNFRIQIFDKDGNFISMFGRHGDGWGDFARPRGLAVNSKGHIYVSDAIFDVVQIFDQKGKFLLNFGSSGGNIGQMFMPAGIAIDANDKVLVADQGNRRLQEFKYVHLPEGAKE